jgi:hypothetical protein
MLSSLGAAGSRAVDARRNLQTTRHFFDCTPVGTAGCALHSFIVIIVLEGVAHNAAKSNVAAAWD